MSARFRIRTAQGQELSFVSHEVFVEFVRTGDLSPDDFVYDAETREWAPARTHPVVLRIQLESEELEESEEANVSAGGGASSEGDADTEADAGVVSGEVGGSRGPADMGLDLLPLSDAPSPAEQAATFVAKMEAERASERAYDEAPAVDRFTLDRESPEVIGGAAPVEPPPHRVQPSPAAPRAPATKRGSGAGRRYVPFVIVAGGMAAAAIYYGPGSSVFNPATGEGADSVVLPPPPPPLIPDTEEAVKGRAQERFLTSTQALLRVLDPIPEIWLHGRYLASPSEYPEVLGAWDEYLSTIRQVRADDNERYRAAYLRALDDARIQGPARTLRLTAATADFQAESGPRDAHYDRVEALATVALQGHHGLLEAEGTISYEPAIAPAVSADPVIEAAGRTPEAQEVLNQVLDLILAQVQGEGGPGEAANVREWVYDGLLDAVTKRP